MKQIFFVLIIFILLCIPSIGPLFSQGYFPMHDDTQIARVVTMGRALRNGQFPVRWVSDLGYGYGYPIYNFYGPLPYYIGGFFYALGVTGITATKLMMVLGMIGAGLSMCYVAMRIGGGIAGIVAGTLYMYFPYHAVQLYVRGAIGELWVLIFLPLILASLYIAHYEKKYSQSLFLGTVGLSGVILSHTILGFITTFFYCFIIALAIIGMVWRKISTNYVKNILLTGAAGIFLASFFWLPAIFEMKYTTVSEQIGPSANVIDHFVCLNQFWYSPWGFGGSTPGCLDGLSFSLGKTHVVFILLGLLGIFFSWKQKQHRALSIISVGIIIFSMFFMTEYSRILWGILPGFSYVQYPWRFLVFTALGISVISIPFLSALRNKFFQFGVALISIAVIIGVNTKLFIPQYTYNRETEAFESEEDIKFRASKVSDEYLPAAIERPRDVQGITKQLISTDSTYVYKDITNKESYKKIEFISKAQKDIVLHHAYFPGWKYWVNSVPQPLRLDKGQPIVTIPEQFSTLEMRFTNTPIRLIGNVISLVCVIVLGYYYGKKTIS